MILSTQPTLREKTEMSDFTDLLRIGTGRFGRIFKATHRLNGKTYALKEISKAVILSSGE